MWRELINTWKSDNLLNQAWNESYDMLEQTQEMFSASTHSLRNVENGELKIDVYEKDQQVNKFEQEVRQKVLKHLAITGTMHLSPGLVLTSIVIDIERIGDYTKNIMDLAKLHPKKLSCGNFEENISKVEAAVGNLFGKVISALKDSDSDVAKSLVDDNWWVIKKCDEIVNDLISKDASCTPRDAVSTALYARYLKRIAAHLLNITTSITNPFAQIGYHGADET